MRKFRKGPKKPNPFKFRIRRVPKPKPPRPQQRKSKESEQPMSKPVPVQEENMEEKEREKKPGQDSKKRSGGNIFSPSNSSARWKKNNQNQADENKKKRATFVKNSDSEEEREMREAAKKRQQKSLESRGDAEFERFFNDSYFHSQSQSQLKNESSPITLFPLRKRGSKKKRKKKAKKKSTRKKFKDSLSERKGKGGDDIDIESFSEDDIIPSPPRGKRKKKSLKLKRRKKKAMKKKNVRRRRGYISSSSSSDSSSGSEFEGFGSSKRKEIAIEGFDDNMHPPPSTRPGHAVQNVNFFSQQGEFQQNNNQGGAPGRYFDDSGGGQMYGNLQYEQPGGPVNVEYGFKTPEKERPGGGGGAAKNKVDIFSKLMEEKDKDLEEDATEASLRCESFISPLKVPRKKLVGPAPLRNLLDKIIRHRSILEAQFNRDDDFDKSKFLEVYVFEQDVRGTFTIFTCVVARNEMGPGPCEKFGENDFVDVLIWRKICEVKKIVKNAYVRLYHPIDVLPSTTSTNPGGDNGNERDLILGPINITVCAEEDVEEEIDVIGAIAEFRRFSGRRASQIAPSEPITTTRGRSSDSSGSDEDEEEGEGEGGGVEIGPVDDDDIIPPRESPAMEEVAFNGDVSTLDFSYGLTYRLNVCLQRVFSKDWFNYVLLQDVDVKQNFYLLKVSPVEEGWDVFWTLEGKDVTLRRLLFEKCECVTPKHPLHSLLRGIKVGSSLPTALPVFYFTCSYHSSYHYSQTRSSFIYVRTQSVPMSLFVKSPTSYKDSRVAMVGKMIYQRRLGLEKWEDTESDTSSGAGSGAEEIEIGEDKKNRFCCFMLFQDPTEESVKIEVYLKKIFLWAESYFVLKKNAVYTIKDGICNKDGFLILDEYSRIVPI